MKSTGAKVLVCLLVALASSGHVVFGASLAGYELNVIPEALEIRGISEDGSLMVGMSQSRRGLLWNNGAVSTFAVGGVNYTELMGVNNSGVISGMYNSSPQQGYTTATSHFGTLDTSIGICCPEGINDSGTIVGWEGSDGFVLPVGGTRQAIQYPGSSGTWAYDINNSGTSVGRWQDGAGYEHGWIQTSAGVFTGFDMPGSAMTGACGLNDAGFIVGDWFDVAGSAHGFVRNPQGTFSTIDVLGALGTVVFDISANGVIVGCYLDSSGKWNGFYASPIPEPATLLLLALGGLAVTRRRR